MVDLAIYTAQDFTIRKAKVANPMFSKSHGSAITDFRGVFNRVGRSTTYPTRVVHDGAEIIRHVPVHCVTSPELTEGETDIFLMYFDVCISVRPLVLVPEAEGMSNLVHWYTELCEREHIEFTHA